MKNRKTNAEKGTISGKVLRWLLAVTAAIIVINSLLVGVRYYQNKINEQSAAAFSYARTAAAIIDGDRISGYVETEQTDEYFDQIQRFFAASVRETNLKYYYVFVPLEDEVVYVWDSDVEPGESSLGYREPYMEGGKTAVEAIYRPDPPERIKLTMDDTYGYIASAFYPILDSSGTPVAVVGVDLSIPSILRTAALYILALSAGILLITSLCAVALFRFIKRSIVEPVKTLSEASDRMVQNLDEGKQIAIDIHTNDELETLAHDFENMHADLTSYIRQNAAITAERERIGAELALANRIQASMLPNSFPAFPDRSEFDIYASMDPAKAVGGDFYDFFLIDDDHLALLIADVSDKGIPAALFMMTVKTLIKDNVLSGQSPAGALEAVNRQICANNPEQMFVTVWLGILDIPTGRLTAANAGHEYPAVRPAAGGFALWKDKHGFVVGGMEGVKYRDYVLELEPGAKIFVYTDGVPEATDAQNELFGADRMLAALNADPDASPEQLLRRLHGAVDAFVGGAEQFDDLTMLCLSYQGRAEGPRELTLEAAVENLPQVTAFLEEILEPLGGAPKAEMQLNMAVEELFSNIAHYAYAPQTGMATIRAEAEREPLAVTVTLIDRGRPYDPLAKEDPDIGASAQDRPIGGLGIFLVKKTMDDVRYEYKDGQNILRIRKRL